MRTTLIPLVCAVTVLAFGSARATTYTDATGDTFTGAGGGILDITSAEVSNDASDLIFKINLAGDPTATDWGKYMIGIVQGGAGDPSGNGWGRPIGISSGSGMNYWLGSWADSGNGVQLFQYSGSWSQTGAAGPFAGTPALAGLSIVKDSSSVTLTVPFSAMGMAAGSTFSFDIYTSGGGGTDGAVDALANPIQTISDWGNSYNSGTLLDTYTIAEVPEPAALSLLGLGGLFVVRRVMRRSA